MQDELINAVMKEVMKRVGDADASSAAPASPPAPEAVKKCTGVTVSLTEYVGALELGETQGIVIANLDPGDSQGHGPGSEIPVHRRHRSQDRGRPPDHGRRRGRQGHQLGNSGR